MDTRYRERVSEEAAEQRWASLPLLGPEEHQLVQDWTNWNKLGRGVTATGRRQRMVFLTAVSKHHSALIAPKEGGGEGNTLLEREQARGSLFSATECYNLILDRL